MIVRSLMSALAVAVLAAAPGGAQQAPEGVRAELLALEARWDSAVVRKDIAALEEIIAPSFVYIGTDGSVNSRAEVFASLQAPDLEIDPFDTQDVQVRLYGSTAVLTGWFEQTGRVGDQAYRVRSRYTDVYVREHGRWVAVSAQATSLPVPE